MICPECKQNRAHRSHRAGFRDWVAALFLRHPYRCRGCDRRFYVYRHGEESPALRSGEERALLKVLRRHRSQRLKREILAYGAGLLVLAVILYFVMQQRIASE